MANANVERFEELLRTDEALRAKLDEATAAYAGDPADEKALFEAVIAPLAAELGLPFSFEREIMRTVIAAVDGDQEAWRTIKSEIRRKSA